MKQENLKIAEQEGTKLYDMRIEDLINTEIKHETLKRIPPNYSPVSKKYEQYESKIESLRAPSRFEKEVFICVDGLLNLKNGRNILLEIKYALNWKNSCNARVEIQRFIEEKFSKVMKEKRPEGALIVFHHFSGDWRETKQYHVREIGWNYFYEEEKILRNRFPTIPVRIAQLGRGRIERSPENLRSSNVLGKDSNIIYLTPPRLGKKSRRKKLSEQGALKNIKTLLGKA